MFFDYICSAKIVTFFEKNNEDKKYFSIFDAIHPLHTYI